jgi:hypothetical protein
MSTRPTTSGHEDDPEPVARWENEGGAGDERDAAAPPANAVTHAVTATQDGQATLRL